MDSLFIQLLTVWVGLAIANVICAPFFSNPWERFFTATYWQATGVVAVGAFLAISGASA